MIFVNIFKWAGYKKFILDRKTNIFKNHKADLIFTHATSFLTPPTKNPPERVIMRKER